MRRNADTESQAASRKLQARVADRKLQVAGSKRRAGALAATRPLSKVLGWPALRRRVAAWRRAGKRIVFTNGCFDLLHVGHVRYLRAAKRLGDVLIVGLNSDASVKRLGKGADRPLVGQAARAEVLSALEMVDALAIFDQDTPWELIRAVQPDVLVKGGDWRPDDIVGADIVRTRGGRVRSLLFVGGFSTTALVRRIRGARA